MVLNLFILVAGLAALALGAESLVRGAARLARSFGVSPLVVGLTVVSFGTSMPELVVSALASAEGRSAVALGNVVGSNIINIALILGLAALITPLRVEMRLLLREFPIMLAATIIPLLFALDLDLGRADATLLLIGFGAYLGFVLRAAQREPAVIGAEFEEFEEEAALEPRGERRAWDVLLVLLGLGGLVLGAQLLVNAAVFLARAIGISELVIGLTVVAIGTSLPELATSVLAGFRREADIAVGNVIGSNIFNMLAILGTAAMIHPIAVDRSLLTLDFPAMVALSILLLPLGLRRHRVGRWEGAVLVAGYAVYTLLLLGRAAGTA